MARRTRKACAALAAAVDRVLSGFIHTRLRNRIRHWQVEPLERRQLLSVPAWLGAGSAATWDSSTSSLTVTGAATIIADPGSDEPSIVASGSAAQLTIAPATSPADVHLGGITLSGGARLDMASVGPLRSGSNYNVLVLGTLGASADPTLSIDSSSTLDLEDNDLIVHTGSSDHGTGSTDQLGVVNTNELAVVAGLAARGRNAAPGGILNGTWTGTGLTSSSAGAFDTAAHFEQLILAVAQNSQLVLGSYTDCTVGSASELLGANDILVKYTFNGDLTLDGGADDNASAVINGLYDNGATTNNPFALGDLNGDGLINDTDITIFNDVYGQGVPSAPDHLTAAQTTAFDVLLTWTGPQGASYSVFRNGQQIATGLYATSYSDTSVSPSTAYTYTVAATGVTGYQSAHSRALNVTTQAVPFATQPPGSPGGLTPTPKSDSEIDLSWSAPGPGNFSYEILRDGVQVGATTSLSFQDKDLVPGTYTYSVSTVDAEGNQSQQAVSQPISTANDSTAPNMPIDVQVNAVTSTTVSLGWVQPWDNTGVKSYDVTQTSYGYPYGTIDLGTTTTASITARGLTAGTMYAFQITAIDAALNKSQPAWISVTTPGNAPAVDQSPDQYIPQVWQDYFYNSLTAALRQKITQLPTGGPGPLAGQVTVPHASGWLSPDTWLLSDNLFKATNVSFHDLNGNLLLDSDEPAWIPAPNEIGFQNGDVIVSDVSVPAPQIGETSTYGTGIWYVGQYNNGIYKSGSDVIVADPWMVQGTTGLYEYCDLAGSGQYTSGDPVWVGDGSNEFHSGDTVLLGSPTPGMYGKTDGLYYYDPPGGTPSDRLIWYDPDSLRQDFVDFYSAMDALAPHFASGQAYPNDAYTVGDLLADVGATPVAGTGTISLQTTGTPQQGTEVIGSGTHFTSEFVPGDNIEINGNWYPVATPVTSDTYLMLASAYDGPSVGDAAFAWINWTKVPQTTDPGTGLPFVFARGEPDLNSAIFPQQFQQLHDALAQLNDYPHSYNEWLFDSATSNQFIQVADQAIATADSLWGNSHGNADTYLNNPDPALKLALQSGDADPGSVFTSWLLQDLQDVVEPITAVIFARQAGGLQGWDTSGGDSPVIFAGSSEMEAALPTFSDTYLTRAAGQLSQFNSSVLPGNPPIDDVQTTELGSLLNAIQSNGLWIRIGAPNVTATTTDTLYYGGQYAGDLCPPYSFDLSQGIPSPTSWPVVQQGTGSVADGGGYAVIDSGPYYGNAPEPPYDTVPDPVYDVAWYNLSGEQLTATMPAGNSYGGNAPGAMATGPNPGDIDMTGWTWGSTHVFFNASAQDILGYLAAGFSLLQIPAPSPTVNVSVYDSIPATLIAPHVSFDGHTDTLTYATWTTPSPQDIGYDADGYLSVVYNAATLYGQVPITPFNYGAKHSAPGPESIALPPTDPLPLTTAMDYFNVMPDDGIDGIVQTPANLSTFGNDTGVVTFTAQNGMAQTILPVHVDTTGTLPVNGYLIQGGFGTSSSSIGSLLSQDISVPNSSQTGVPWAYSLDTRVRINLLVDDAQNHVKRVEVIRPGGNAVVFDFAWDSTKGMFSPAGTPDGWSARDAKQTYVLRALDPTDDSSLSYELLFANGIVQTFGGLLESVSDASTGLTQTVWGGPLPQAMEIGQQDTADNSRYDMTPTWTNGNITSIAYQTSSTLVPSHTIQANLSYNSSDASALNKSEDPSTPSAQDGTPIPQFSYSSISAGSITFDGVTTTRSGSLASGSVTIATTLPTATGFASGSSKSETFTFNANNLVTSDAVTLNEGDGNPTTATTTFRYQDATGIYSNGSPKWSKVTLVTNPDGSWTGYEYDDPKTGPTTGWMTGIVTPFESSAWQPGDGTSSDDLESLGYDDTQSGDGQGADPAMLVQPPDTVTTFVQGSQTGETFNNYNGTNIVTRQALSDSNGTWANAGMFSTTAIQAYNSSSTTSVMGNVSQSLDTSSGTTTDTVTSSWFNDTLSQNTITTDPFGEETANTNESLGQAYQRDTATKEDSFGRPLNQTLTSGAIVNSYTNPDGTTNFFGPVSVTAADGSETDYTYTPLGQVATQIIYAGSAHSVEYSYVYDAAGNVVIKTVTALDASGNPSGTPLVTTYQYDAQDRQLKEVDNAGGTDLTADRTTTTVYSPFDGTYNTTTVTNPDGSTQVTNSYLDGTIASVGGTGATPETDSEGVVAGDTPDANGNVETAGSTWVMSSSDNGVNWTKTFTNMLGEVYLVQQSDPSTSAAAGQTGTYSDALTKYNLNGQAYEQIDFTGTATYTIYDPLTGQAGATWVDVNGNGSFDPGVDSKTIYTPTPMTNDPTVKGGVDTQTLSATGTQDDNQVAWSGGLDSSDTQDGLTTTTETIYDGGGEYRILTTNPDGTQQQDTYTDGLLTESDQLDSGEGLIAKATYTYNGMRELATESDSTGQTVFAYYQDGTQKSQTDPANNTTTYNTPNEQANQPVTTTLPDGTTQSDTFDEQGNLVGQSGAGQLAATFGYDTGGTGELTSLTTAAGTTNWAYDLNTGQLQSETFGDQTQDVFKYNDKGLLSSETMPGVNAAFGYDAYGDLTSANYKDSVTGVLQVQSLVTQQDDLGRPLVTTSLDNGQITSEADTYTPTGDLGSEIFGSAGSTAVTYGYDPTNNTAGTGGGDADAVSSITASTPGEQTVSQGYTYDSDGRLATITVNGVTLTYHYLGDSDQIQTITAGDVTTAYTPQSNDGSLLQEIKVTAGTQDVYLGGYTYNADDQRATDSVTQTDATGNTTSQNLSYTYAPSLADALTQVKDGSNNVLYSYNYDGAGDFLGNATLGTANNVNEYSNLIYNARHDLIGDGTYTYGYDLLDRLICVRPDTHTNGTLSARFGYDSQGRMQWENVYAWWGSWTLSTTYHFVWSGSELIEKLDSNDKVLQQYTWGPGQDGNDHVLLLTDFTGTSPHTYTLAYDASGNVSMLLDPSTGAVVATYSYAPYGALVGSTGNASINPWLGKGYWTDAAAPGIGWAQPDTVDGTTRESNFSIGLWLQDDPTGFNGGLNPTSVEGNDPINNVDPDGTRYFPGWSAETSKELRDLDTREREWASKDWNVAADMLDHFLNGNGTVLRTLPQKDIEEIKADPDEAIKDAIIDDIYDHHLSTEIGPSGLLPVSSNEPLEASWGFLFGNPNLFYGFAHVGVQYKGTYNSADRTLTLSVTLLKHYNFSLDHPSHYMGFVWPDWRAAHALQAKGVAKDYDMRVTFDWTINDVLPPPYTYR